MQDIRLRRYSGLVRYGVRNIMYTRCDQGLLYLGHVESDDRFAVWDHEIRGRLLLTCTSSRTSLCSNCTCATPVPIAESTLSRHWRALERVGEPRELSLRLLGAQVTGRPSGRFPSEVLLLPSPISLRLIDLALGRSYYPGRLRPHLCRNLSEIQRREQ